MARSVFLGAGSDQSLNTTDSPTFAGVTTPTVTSPQTAGFTLSTPDGTGATPDARTINIFPGDGFDPGGSGGTINLEAGAGRDGASAGIVNISAGNGHGNADAAYVQILGGAGVGTNKAGGSVIISTGLSTGTSAEGQITFSTGTAGASGATPNVQSQRGTMDGEVFTWDGAMTLTPRAVASLPASPVEGMLAWVNDSNTATWGATIAGGGANKVLAVYNGSNWTVAGK